MPVDIKIFRGDELIRKLNEAKRNSDGYFTVPADDNDPSDKIMESDLSKEGKLSRLINVFENSLETKTQ